MALRLQCKCGHHIETEGESFGPMVDCPACGLVLCLPLAPAAAEGRAAAGGVSQIRVAASAQSLERSAAIRSDGANESVLAPLLAIEAAADGASPSGLATFPLAADDAPILEPEDAEARPRRERKHKEQLRQERKVLRTVSIGLTLMWWGILCFLLSIVVLMATAVAAALASMFGEFLDSSAGVAGAVAATGPAAFLVLIYVIGSVLQLLAALLIWAGKLFCCWAPKKSEARHLIAASFALDAPALGLLTIALLVLALGPTALPAALLQMLVPIVFLLMGAALILMLISFILFFMFLRRFAAHLEEPGIASEARDIMFWWVLLSIGWPIVFGVLAAAAALSYALVAVLLLVVFVGGFWWFYQYVRQWVRLLNLTGALRDVLANQYRV